MVDGTNVTSKAIITSGFVTYKPDEPLADGAHTVMVTAQDMAGNRAHANWSFTVSATQGMVSGFESNLSGADSVLLAGQPLNVTLHAQPGGAASFNVGSVASNIAMQENSPWRLHRYLPAQAPASTPRAHRWWLITPRRTAPRSHRRSAKQSASMQEYQTLRLSPRHLQEQAWVIRSLFQGAAHRALS